MNAHQHFAAQQQRAAIAAVVYCETVLADLGEPACARGMRVRWTWLVAHAAVIKARLRVGDRSEGLADEVGRFGDASLAFLKTCSQPERFVR